MRCPACGQWNRNSVPVCVKCGAALAQAPDAEPTWKGQLKTGTAPAYIRVDEDGEENREPDARDVLAQEMAELKRRKELGTRQQRRLREESAQRGLAPSTMTIRTHSSVDTFWDHMDEPAPDEIPASRTSGSRTQVRQGSTVRRRLPPERQDRSTFDPSWPESAYYNGTTLLPDERRFTGKLPGRGHGMRRLMYMITLVLIGVALGLGIYFGVHWLNEIRESNVQHALVSASIHNNLAAHTIQIPGEDGQQIYIRELHAYYTVADGYATVDIEDHVWYDDIEDFVSDTIQVKLTPLLKTSSGKQEPLEQIVYDIDVPLSPITLVSPDVLRTEVVTAMYSLSFEVRPGSKVYMNGKDISDTLDASTGSLSYNATVQPIGDNDFVLRVRSPYCRENSLTVTLYREPQEIPLDLSADTYTSTTLHELEIKATTLPGAVVEVLSPHTDLRITELNATGEFSFYAIFDKIGNNTVTITSSMPGKKTSVVNYVIYYLPNIDVYSRKAWPLNPAEYSELVSNIGYRAEHSQVYVVMSKLAYLVSDKPQLGVFYTSTDGKSQPVLVENCTKKKWEVGKYYRIYADADSVYADESGLSMPRLNGRYVYAN